MNPYPNLCWRCGKERIIVKSWKEKIGYSTITTTETACPDIECQKLVNKENKKRSDKFKTAQLKRKESLNRNGKQRVNIH